MHEAKKDKLKLTSRGKYAVMALVELALHPSDAPLPLSLVAERGNLSLSYLEQLFSALRRHDLVKSHRGPGGGYVLAREPDSIAISEILLAAEDSAPGKRPPRLREDRTRPHQTHALWSLIGDILEISMKRVSLGEVVRGDVGNNPYLRKLFETLE